MGWVVPGRVVSALAFASFVFGCGPDIGDCADPAEAREVVFARGTGEAAFAGQALSIAHCSSCHSPSSIGPLRVGAPAGLDFDVRPAQNDADLARLRAEQRRTYEQRYTLAREVHLGDMPPPNYREPSPYYHRASGAGLPRIIDPEGTTIYNRWLACGTPVVARTIPAPTPEQAGQPCPGSTPEAICIYGQPQTSTATWSSIFENVFSQSCSRPGCHTAGGLGGVSFDDKNEAYAQLLGSSGQGGMPLAVCAGSGELLVVPNRPDDSLLVKKLEGTQTCGGPMTFVSNESLALVRAWITAGAAND